MPFLNMADFRKVQDALSELADQPARMIAQGIMTNAADGIVSHQLRELANDIHGTDEVEIDDEGAGTSPGDEGTWVQAWVWVSRPEMVAAGLLPEEPECPHCFEPYSMNWVASMQPCPHCNGLISRPVG